MYCLFESYEFLAVGYNFYSFSMPGAESIYYVTFNYARLLVALKFNARTSIKIPWNHTHHTHNRSIHI